MTKSDAFENSLLLLYFNATAHADLAENDTTTPATNLSCALHTGAGPLDAGDQSTLEAAYTSYARKDVIRTSGGWTVTASSVSPVANIDFIEATGGSETETFFSVGPSVAGDIMLYFGAITPTIVVVSTVQPILANTSTIVED